MTFGNYLRELREAKGWTQPEAADRAGIEQSYLSKLETGRSYPSDDVFSRIAEAYGIDAGELARRLPAGELERLREIRQVRSAVLSMQKTTVRATRGWLIGGLASLVLAGASAGFVAGAEDERFREYSYRSMGVLAEGEQLDAFEIVRHRIRPDESNSEEASRQRAMLERIDARELVTRENRGDGFIESVAGGRRYFDLYNVEQIAEPSPLRWFVVPALMFLAAGMGCFLVAFRWR